MNRNKEVTIYDIARVVNVSPATVSRALKKHPAVKTKTRQKIEEAARKMGYRSNSFASNLRMQKTHTIGVMMHELNSNFMTSVLAGIESVTTPAGYDLIIAHSSEDAAKEAANANNLFHKRVDGLITSLSYDTGTLSHFDPFVQKNIPVVFFDRVEKNAPGVKVVIDNFKAGYEATRHLLDEGCKYVIHLTGNLKRNVYADRLEGYKQALNDKGLSFKQGMAWVGELDEAAGIAAAEKIATLDPRPDGLFVTNDFCAAVCMQRLRELGLRIPRDIAVIGFNNDNVTRIVQPRLSTIDYPGKQVGAIAATELLNSLQHQVTLATQTQDTIVIPSKLIVRESSQRNN